MIITLFWIILNGATYQACYREGAAAQVCVTPSGSGRHDFTGLKFDTDYSFTYKENGVESNPMVVHTPVKKNPSAPTVQIVAQ